MPARFTGLLGLGAFIFVAWLLSSNRRAFPWRTVLTGLLLQGGVAVLALRTAAGAAVFGWLDQAFLRLLAFADEGNKLVFGPLGDREFLAGQWGQGHSFIFAISISGTIILVAALSSFLYHYGILQRVVRAIAFVMERCMRTSGSESLAAAANIFMGQTEAPMMVKPYMKNMTRSELMALMTGGMATIAGGVLAAYVGFGIPAGHLITASIMSAPAALMIAKVMLPESEVSETAAGARADVGRETTNGIDALCQGAADGVRLAINVMAMLIAFVAVVALVNFLLGWMVGLFGGSEAQPLQRALGWLNAPFAWLMGISWRDCGAAGSLLGERIVLNEFFAYYNLTQSSLDPHSRTVLTYALCGFANFGSVAIQIGGIGSVVPERRADLASLGIRSMIGGLLACYCTAAIAGLIA